MLVLMSCLLLRSEGWVVGELGWCLVGFVNLLFVVFLTCGFYCGFLNVDWLVDGLLTLGFVFGVW